MGRVVMPLIMSRNSINIKKIIDKFKDQMIQSEFLE